MRKILWIALSLCILTGCNDAPIASSISSVKGPAQIKADQMANAFELGETLFLYNGPADAQRALWSGGQRIVFLKPGMLRSVRLTSQECINLVVKKEYKDEKGDTCWSTTYSFQNVLPGDYVYFQDGLWRVTKYTP